MKGCNENENRLMKNEGYKIFMSKIKFEDHVMEETQ